MTRIRIINAGIECFSRSSYASVTMNEIAKHAGLTKRTVYKYYSSKAALIASIFEQRLQELNTLESNALLKCSTTKEVIITLFKVLNDYTKNNFSFMQMFWALKDNISGGVVPEDVVVRILAWNRILIDNPASFIAQKGLTGLFAAYSPNTIVHYISALNKGIFLQTDKDSKLNLTAVFSDDLTCFARDILLFCLDNGPSDSGSTSQTN